ncbi:MAG: HTH domain-containing protein [Syntrophomonadaceae bacterium]|jgi:central glycolytic genes regulator|nr:HTH domain-containing protein [Syntrophomonadaceae bacterium]
MDRILLVLERLAPEAIELIDTRYKILRQIYYHEPVGRRQLCKELNLSERTVRSEIDKLKARGAALSTSAGINLSPSGRKLLQEMSDIVPSLLSIQPLAEKIKQSFHVKEVLIVPGDSSEDYLSQKDLGRAAAGYLRKMLKPDSVLAVTGGTTLAEMAAAMKKVTGMNDVLVVPARGGLGEGLEQQAGTIAANIADTLGAQYRLLHIPDNIEENTAEILKKDVHVKDILQIIKTSSILIHGIGPAMEMAARRGLSPTIIDMLQEKNAVAEAFRYYFDEKGNIVYEVPGIGLEMNDLSHIEIVVAVAGGKRKAEAIKAVLGHGQLDVLITDEGAAREIIQSIEKGWLK